MEVSQVETSLTYRLELRPYQYRFRQPLKTYHGVWTVREGALVRLSDDKGREGWGEIAPLPWFGSETLEDAIAWCKNYGSVVTSAEIAAIPAHLPACQFALESALEQCLHPHSARELPPQHYSYLLPAGARALQAWQPLWEAGGRTFKWKIGVEPIAVELQLFDRLVEELPPGVKLRLDANGGLTLATAKQWLSSSERAGCVEFIEQPLSPDEFETMLRLSDSSAIPLALDESVASLVQLQDCHNRGWRGIFVIKAAIAGSPQRLRQFCQHHPLDAVFSSVFETAIGRQAALHLAAELGNPHRAVGFGIESWFDGEG
ncbi:o-succinylbenzoate synthase [Oscillatoria sp. FACHB-1406]|uniref:o-succinylbenzoate synthase n=1 Tax=Oscillatoria sp. FACHB-1406 TaxID=2692846 RepID=UPI001683D66A|nr:o-succinylbenzoate synthase [Oscillatoria sp. FACHB-1406]MBD2577034.1 o-succinylbenzoate synthase [Oscillatoria sp. FACHB-1406]